MSFRQNMILLISASLALNPLFAYGQECGAYLNSKTTDSKSTALVPLNQTSLTNEYDSNPAPLAMPKQNFDRPYSSAEMKLGIEGRFSDGMHAQLSFVELTYSNYFNSIVEDMELTPNQLNLTPPSEIQIIATKVYKQIRAELVDRKSGNIDHLNNPGLTLEVLTKLPMEFIIDKFGENLIAIGLAGEFLRYNKSFESAPNSFSSNAVAKIITGSIGTLSVMLMMMSQAVNDTFFYTDGYYSNPAHLNTFTVGTFAGAILSGLALISSGTVFKFFENRKIRNYQKAAIHARDITPKTKDLFLYVDTEKGKLKESVKRITVLIDGAAEQTVDSSSLLTYGSTILNLHKSLVDVFVNDFLQWMLIYDSQSLRIKENLKNIRASIHTKPSTGFNAGSNIESSQSTSSSASTISVLSNIFIEAAEGTRQTMDASLLITEMLNQHLGVLNQINQAKLNKADQLDWARKSNVLRQALLAQTQFTMHLESVYLTISNILASLDQIIVVESSLSIRKMGQHLALNQEVTETIDNLLVGLDEMDKQLESMMEKPGN